ncbi:ABC transporter permease [Ruminococcaceae bacterium OttesenSCG-928-I18]|nr:ABC transporter permease [Ruminococcaceae bacterium OttesenSCG-928-I18]
MPQENLGDKPAKTSNLGVDDFYTGGDPKIRSILLLVHEGHYEEALLHFEALPEGAFDEGAVAYYYGVALASTRTDPEGTKQAFKMLNFALNSGFSEYWVLFHRGMLYQRLGNVAAAAQDYKKAIALEPDGEYTKVLQTTLGEIDRQKNLTMAADKGTAKPSMHRSRLEETYALKMNNREARFHRVSSLLRELVSRDIKVKYRGSLLGLLWSVLSPLLMMVVLTIIFSTIFRNDIPNFPIYYLSGYLIFTLNSEATQEGMYSIISNASLLKKVYVPKYLFPVSKVFTALVNSIFSIIAMFIIMIITGAPFYPTLLMIPVLLVYTTMFSCGLTLFLSAVGTRFRDLCYIYSVVVFAWMFFTPLFYPASSLSGLALFLMNFNPLYHLVNFSRSIILYGVMPPLWLNLACLGLGVGALLVGGFTFSKLQKKFIFYI